MGEIRGGEREEGREGEKKRGKAGGKEKGEIFIYRWPINAGSWLLSLPRSCLVRMEVRKGRKSQKEIDKERKLCPRAFHHLHSVSLRAILNPHTIHLHTYIQ